MGVAPDPAIAAEVPDSVDDGFAAVGANRDGLVDAPDVGEEVAIAEYVDGGLVVKDNPEAVEDAVVGLSKTVGLPNDAARISPSVGGGNVPFLGDVDMVGLEAVGDDGFDLVAGERAKSVRPVVKRQAM